MTDMDEIRGLVGDYGAAEFRAGRFVESGSTTRSAACRDADDKRSALLQRVETLRAERDAALAPSPPETPAPEDACGGYESGCSCDGCIRRETEHLAWIERVRARRGAAPASPASAPSRGSGDGSYEWAYTESLNILQAALDGLPEAEADLPMPRMARQAAAAIMRLRGAPSPTSTDPGAEVKPS